MEKKELLEKLIAHYEKSIELVKGESELGTLQMKHVNWGVCRCAKKVFNQNIYHEEWVLKYGSYWDDYPIYATSIPEAISLLQVRVDIMRKELAEC
jgi:hypothetical protein